MNRTGASRPAKRWPAWIDDILACGPIAEPEPEWRAEIGDAITRALDLRAGTVEVYNCRACGAARYRAVEPEAAELPDEVYGFLHDYPVLWGYFDRTYPAATPEAAQPDPGRAA